MRRCCIGVLFFMVATALVFGQVGRLGSGVVVDPSGTITASRNTPDGPPLPPPRLPDGNVNLFFRFRDWLGRYPMHCHNVIHEDHAMMLRWDIAPTGDNNQRP